MNLDPEDLLALEFSKDDLEMFNTALHIQFIKEQKKQTEALELLATSQALQTCLKLEKHNKINTPQYTALSCSSLREKFSKLVEKNNNQS